MPQIQFDQLKPGMQSSTLLSIPNASTGNAFGAIEISRLTESKPLLASYIQISIREQRDEPRVVYGPATLSTLYQHGYTTLSMIAPNTTATYEALFIVAKDMPSEFQKQKITFDVNIGTETIAVSPLPSPAEIHAKLSEIATTSGQILGTTSTAEIQTPALENPSGIPLFTVIIFITALLILILWPLLRHRHSTPG